MTAISMLRETFWLWDSQLLPVERWSDLDGRKLAQAHLREAGKPTREGGRPLGLPMGRTSTSGMRPLIFLWVQSAMWNEAITRAVFLWWSSLQRTLADHRSID